MVLSMHTLCAVLQHHPASCCQHWLPLLSLVLANFADIVEYVQTH
jgi:hypothetical protein